MTNIATIEARKEIQPRATSATPADLLELAINQGADLDRLEKLMELQDRWEAKQARNAYVAAMSAFKADPPTIYKTKGVSFSGTSYSHATLGEVTDLVCQGLGKHGLSHRWDTKQEDNGMITVTCIITHVLGHSESTTLRSKADDSGKKNAIQQVASAITYLQRYTLLAATGLATKDMIDDDGRGSEPPPETISAEQCATIRDWIASTGSNEKAFCEAFKIETIAQLPVGMYSHAIHAFEVKSKKGGAK